MPHPIPLILNLLQDGPLPLAIGPPAGYNGGNRAAQGQGGSGVATFVFDTHRAVKDLEEAGFPEAQAEALVEIVGLAVGENAATKGDLDAMERRLEAKFTARFGALENKTEARFTALEQQTEARFTALEQQMEIRFAAQEDKFNARIDALEGKLNARIDALEHKLDAEIRAVRADLRNMEWRITLKFVAILLPSMGLLFAALRFLT